jgi:hypothetical protein
MLALAAEAWQALPLPAGPLRYLPLRRLPLLLGRRLRSPPLRPRLPRLRQRRSSQQHPAPLLSLAPRSRSPQAALPPRLSGPRLLIRQGRLPPLRPIFYS